MAKVLVAEDNKYLRRAYIAKLPKEGFEIEIVEDGKAVMEKVKSFKPDLIILDIIMPQRNGLDILKELKETPVLNKIPVIITSSLDKSEDVKKGLEIGADDYLVKTEVSMDDIVAKIRGLLK